jgi:hypothetical protein
MGSSKRHRIGSRKRPVKFTSDELETIDRVYHAAWSQIIEQHPQPDREKAKERQGALRKRLLVLAGRGAVEFSVLRDRVLATMPETLMHPTRRD